MINLVTEDLAFATDWCGVRSGKDFDKFKEMKLTPVAGQVVKAPLIEESPLSLECKVVDVKEMGSHDMFARSMDTSPLVTLARQLHCKHQFGRELLASIRGQYDRDVTTTRWIYQCISC